MNFHTFLDHYTVIMGALLMGKRKFFSKSVDSQTVEDILHNSTIHLPDIDGSGVYEVDADTPAGTMDPAFYVAQWRGSDYPTLIYHHGNNERPFDFGTFSKNTFKSIIFDHKQDFEANLIVVRAPYHQSLKTYMNKVVHLSNFAGMLAVSVRLIEALIRWSRQQGSSRLVVSGISLGGWVTNMHRVYFNSADCYLPMLAGAALDEVFISSAYRKMTGQLAHENPDKVRGVLNFEEPFSQVDTDNVFPLLARYDPIIEYERQRQCYDTRLVKVIDKGHTTAVLDNKTLRDFLLSHLP